MSRSRTIIAFALSLVVLVLVLAACGGSGDGEKSPSGTTTPPSAVGSLPPEFLECMSEQGFEVGRSGDIHSAPPQALQACFATLHEGSGP